MRAKTTQYNPIVWSVLVWFCGKPNFRYRNNTLLFSPSFILYYFCASFKNNDYTNKFNKCFSQTLNLIWTCFRFFQNLLKNQPELVSIYIVIPNLIDKGAKKFGHFRQFIFLLFAISFCHIERSRDAIYQKTKRIPLPSGLNSKSFFLKPKFSTRNSKPETRNFKPETRNPKPLNNEITRYSKSLPQFLWN